MIHQWQAKVFLINLSPSIYLTVVWCNASTDTVLQASVLLLDSSSDSKSDNDMEIIESLIQSQRSVCMHLNVLKGYSIMLKKESRNCIRRYFEEVIVTYTYRIFRSVYEELCTYICIKFGEIDIYNSQRKDKCLSEIRSRSRKSLEYNI